MCIAHTSSKETVAILERERAAGNHSFYLESCPHYMHFTRKNMEGPMGALYTMNPPLRSQQDADALLAAMIQEEISILSTDHCPYSKNYMVSRGLGGSRRIPVRIGNRPEIPVITLRKA